MTEENDNIKFSKADQETLHRLTDILHLFHHRNKNQHRRSVWWRHFSVFRKQLNHLDAEISTLNATPQTHLERSRKKTKDKETKLRISRRLDFWRDTLVPKWSHAFSQVVADGRFAVLGLVLTAVLAQVCHVTGITEKYDDMGQTEVEKVIADFGRELWDGKEVGDGKDSKMADFGEDLGQVIARDEPITTEDVADVKEVKIEESITATARKPSPRPKKTTRRKRNRGDAIDDLFSGLD